MHWKRTAWTGCAVALAAFGTTAMPVFGADNATVTANVVAGVTACITVTPSGAGQNVSFGTQPYNAPGSSAVSIGSPNIQVTNCGTGSATLLARGTDATNPVATWSLTNGTVCSSLSPQLDQYKLGFGGPVPTYLTTTNSTVASLGIGGQPFFQPVLVMPCTGSQGNGQTMTMSYIFTATA